MRRRSSSILARTGLLFIVVGIVLVFFGLGQNRVLLEQGFLLLALAVVTIEMAVALGWDAFADLAFVTRQLRRGKTAVPIPATAPDLLQVREENESHLRPSIKAQISLLTLGLIAMFAAIVLEILKMVRGLPFWGDATIDTIAYFCAGGAALFYLLRFALDGIFSLRGRKGRRKSASP